MKIKITLKNRKKLLIVMLIIVLISSGVGGYFWYRSHVKSSNYFLQILHEYDDSAQSMHKNWTQIVTKAKTPLHFMMLLKRLDKWDLQLEYRNTLVRSLWKFPKVHSLLALSVEYYISYSDGDIFDEYLQDVDVLWNEYPNLIRLYFIELFEKKGLKNQYDELLQLFYKVANNTDSWETLSTLWQLTENPIFLYVAGIRASMEGEPLIAQTLYESFPLEWQTLYAEYYENLAWIVNDTEFLQPIVESNHDIESYIRLAGTYIRLNRYKEGYTLLSNYMETFPQEAKAHASFLEMYLWLASRVEGQKGLEDDAVDIYASSDLNLMKAYVVYTAKYDEENLVSVLQKFDSTLLEAMLEDPFLDYLVTFLDPLISIDFLQAFIWQKTAIFTDTSSKIRMLHIALRYFLHNNLLDDYLMMISKSTEYPEVQIPYEFYFSVKYSSEDKEDTLQKISEESDAMDFQWWHYYNLGVYKLGLVQYQQAERLLHKSLELLEEDYNNIKHKEFPLVQLARLYLEQKNFESSQYYLQELKALYPTNNYAEELRHQIEFQTTAIEAIK